MLEFSTNCSIVSMRSCNFSPKNTKLSSILFCLGLLCMKKMKKSFFRIDYKDKHCFFFLGLIFKINRCFFFVVVDCFLLCKHRQHAFQHKNRWLGDL